MRKYILTAVLAVAFCFAGAQNIQLHYDMGTDRQILTSTIEYFKPDKYGNTFFFVDMDYSGAKKGVGQSYFEIARELKFWNAPISAHIEYNGGQMNGVGTLGNAYLAGPSYTYLTKDFSGSFTLMVLYKYIEQTPTRRPHNYQITAVWSKNFCKDKLTISGFADFWREDQVVSKDGFVNDFSDSKYIFISEPQIWYNCNKNLSMGSEIELANDFAGHDGFKVRPTLALKWNF
jgi:hypothetical protein